MKKFLINLKKRFKRALFSFFREEILENVEKITKIHEVLVQPVEYEIKEIRSSISFDRGGNVNLWQGMGYEYEESLDYARKEIIKEAMKCITINEENVITPNYYHDRKIELKLYIAQKKK